MNKKQNKIIKKLIVGAITIGASSFLVINFANLFNKNNNSKTYTIENNTYNNSSNINSENKLRLSKPNDNNFVDVTDTTSGVTYTTCSVDVPTYLNDTSNLNTNRIWGYKLVINNIDKFIANPNVKSEINGYPLISISGTFLNKTALKIPPILPNTILDMNNAFKGCTYLESLPNIPSGVMYLENAFYGCDKVVMKQDLVIPSSVISMSYAFYGCSSLDGNVLIQSIKLTSDKLNLTVVNTIQNAFSGASKIKSVIFSDPITYFFKNNFGFSSSVLSSISTNQVYSTTVSTVDISNYPWLYLYGKLNSCDINDSNFLNFLNIDGVNRFQATIDGKTYKKTEFTIYNFSYDLEKGECTFQLNKSNYFDATGNYIETSTKDGTLYKLTGFYPIQNATNLVQTKTLDIKPSSITNTNWTNYFTFENIPTSGGVQYIFISANAKDYDPITKKSSLTLTINISKYFDNVNGKLSLVTTPKDFSITIESDVVQLPTECTQASTEEIASRGLTPKNQIYPNQIDLEILSSYLTFKNLPSGSKIKLVIKNESTLNRDGFILVDVYLTKWYDPQDGSLKTQSDAGWDVGNFTKSTINFPSISILGFKSVPGETKLLSKNRDLSNIIAEEFKNQFNDNTWNQFLEFTNLPENSRTVSAQVINWNNTLGTVSVEITISSYFDTNYQYIEQNKSYNYTFNNLRKIESNGETTLTFDVVGFREYTKNNFKYPSQVQANDILQYIKINNPYTPVSRYSLGTQINIKSMQANDATGTISVNIELKNRLVNSGNGWVLDPTSVMQTAVFTCAYETGTKSGTTRIVAKDLKGIDIPETIETYEFNKYFTVENPLYGEQPKVDIIKDSEGNIISGNISTTNNWLVINKIESFPSERKVVASVVFNSRIVNGELEKKQSTLEVVNYSFTSNSQIDRGDDWQNGTNWMWLIIGIGIAFAAMLLIIVLICVICSIIRRNYECDQKKTIHMWNPNSALPSTTGALAYDTRPQLTTTQNSVRQIEHRPVQQQRPVPQQTTTTRKVVRSSSSNSSSNINKEPEIKQVTPRKGNVDNAIKPTAVKNS